MADLAGLAEFAVVQSYLSTAAKWGVDKLAALRQLLLPGRGCHLRVALAEPGSTQQEAIGMMFELRGLGPTDDPGPGGMRCRPI